MIEIDKYQIQSIGGIETAETLIFIEPASQYFGFIFCILQNI